MVIADDAPALTRGLSLLRRLDADGPSSLERLTRVTGWPKSSVARMLRSLEATEAVWRDPATKRYQPRLRLTPVDGGDDRLRAAWRSVADRLARATGQTVELHRFDGRSLVMIDRLEPEEAIVSATARIGFQRQFDEIDALTQVVLAYGLSEPHWPGGKCWSWSGGRKTPLNRRRRRELADQARGRGVATDTGVNPNGIFRYAAPVLAGGDRLEAVVAVAQVCVPGRQADDPQIVQLIKDAGRALCSPAPATELPSAPKPSPTPRQTETSQLRSS